MKKLFLILALCSTAFGQVTLSGSSSISGTSSVTTVAGGGGGTPALLGSGSNSSSGTVTIAMSPAASASSTIFVGATGNSGSCTTFSASDTLGNTYSRVGRQDDGSFASGDILYATNTHGAGANTISVTCDGFPSDAILATYGEFSNVATTTPLDKVGANSSYSFALPVSGTTATTSQANELLIGCFSFAVGNAVAAGSGWTAITGIFNGTLNRSNFCEYQVVSATGAYQATSTDVASGTYAGVGFIATFKY